MANDTILTPGGEYLETTTPVQESELYLEKDKYLSEYESEGEKSVVRENLDVYAKDAVYTKLQSDIKLDEAIKKAFDKYLNIEDPHGILPVVREMIEGFVKNDGSTPFIAPQIGVDPIQDFHLVTKRFVTKILRDHINEEDPHRILPEVLDILELYVKQSEIYFKSLLYTKLEIDKQSGQYIKKDGSTPFTKALIGSDPQIDSHLATKRYVDNVIHLHLVDIDPHGFTTLLNNRLASYAKVKNVYDKSLTYSRTLIDSVIRSLVGNAALEALLDHLHEFDPHHILDEVRKEKYIKLDGSVPFKSPLKGLDAVDPQDLVTLHQVEEKIKEVDEKSPIWTTSGPVQTTVGFVEDNTNIPELMTFLEIMDAIFYGKLITMTTPEYITIGDTGEITVCVHGSTGLIESAVLYLNDIPVYTFDKEEFESGCVTVNSNVVDTDTTFTFRVIYTNGTTLEETKTVLCTYPTFVGLLPLWKFGNTVTMDYLEELALEDSTNNRFIEGMPSTIILKYSFKDSNLRHPFVVIPAEYPDLESMIIKSLSFGKEAFDVIDLIPLQVNGLDITYKIYVYRQALSSLNLEVTFNFEA